MTGSATPASDAPSGRFQRLLKALRAPRARSAASGPGEVQLARILDLFEEFCGARLTYNSMRIGGLPLDIPPGWDKKVLEFCKIMDAKIDESLFAKPK